MLSNLNIDAMLSFFAFRASIKYDTVPMQKSVTVLYIEALHLAMICRSMNVLVCNGAIYRLDVALTLGIS